MSETNKKQSNLAEQFATEFSIKKNNISGRIEKLNVSSSTNVSDELTLISNEIQKLSKTLHDAIIFLPSYSVKVRQDEVRDLEKQLKEKEYVLIPKKKFGFKSTIKPKDVDVSQTISELNVKSEAKTIYDNKINSNFFTVENVDCVTSTYEESQLNGNDVMVRNVTGSTIYLNGSPSTLRFKNVKDCKIICGPVHTSIFIENCKDSIFIICCQQLRTHSSEKLDIYLRVSSRAIIEDCNGIRFGPYSWKYPRSSELHSIAGISDNLERFDAVDDFNWLSATSKSPNWTVIPVEDIIDDFDSGPKADP